ncbi:MAG: ATP synthase F1 subunit epsilon [Thermoanaerobacteraceae bacterium]|nr:ATP synthase F1 subunit epsilon [Thermoanaerobacteraceae bacterium]
MKKFHLEVLTLYRKFYDGEVDEIVISTSVGKIGILAGHVPMVADVAIGTIKIKVDDKWKEAFVSSGFMEVQRDKVTVFVESAEWPEEIDILRAKRAKERAQKKIKEKLSRREYILARAALRRALVRMNIAEKNKDI